MKYLTTLAILLLSILGFSQVKVTTLTKQFNGSGGVKIGPDGNVYIGDFGQSLGNSNGTQVWKMDLEGNLTVFARGLRGASGNDFDSKGNLFQANIAGGYISKITPDGKVTTFASTGITGPVGVVIDSSDNLYVCNCAGALANTIRKVTPQGQVSLFSSGMFNCPNGITIDNNNNLYVSNFGNGNVIKVDPNGNSSVLAFIPGGSNGHVSYSPTENVLYVASHGSHKIYRLTMDGKKEVLIGTGVRGNKDGGIDEATFSRPNGVAISMTGDTIFVNSSIPTQDNPSTGFRPLNPSVIRMITGVRALSNPTKNIVNTSSLKINIFPNPSNDHILLKFSLEKNQQVKIDLIDIQGRIIRRIQAADLNAGLQKITINTTDLKSGKYFIRLRSDEFEVSRAFVVMKK